MSPSASPQNTTATDRTGRTLADKLDEKLDAIDIRQLPFMRDLEPWLQTCISLAMLVLAATALRTVAGLVITHTFRHIRETVISPTPWTTILLHPTVGKRLAQAIAPLVFLIGLPLVPNLHATAAAVLGNIAIAASVLYAARVLTALLDAMLESHTLHADSEADRARSIKSYVQLGKLLVFLAAAVIMVAALIDRSPLILLSGLGAMSAVLLLVFKDTILSFTAGLQLTANDTLRVGDWIEMAQVGANGRVTDIALHTVKVQNWDNTFTTIPTWRLMSESFINWRGMTESGGRRIRRTLRIDATSVTFLDETRIELLSHIALLKTYLARGPAELQQQTNLGAFRAYADAWLRTRTDICQDMMLMVRSMESTPEGIPLEIYCFTRTTSWVPYEATQSDIFDHLMAVLSAFGLRLYQHPSGMDLRTGLRQSTARQAIAETMD